MGQPEVESFLTHLGTDLEVSASIQNQALAALLFLICRSAQKALGDVGAQKTNYIQPYLSSTEVRRVLDNLIGAAYLAPASYTASAFHEVC